MNPNDKFPSMAPKSFHEKMLNTTPPSAREDILSYDLEINGMKLSSKTSLGMRHYYVNDMAVVMWDLDKKTSKLTIIFYELPEML